MMTSKSFQDTFAGVVDDFSSYNRSQYGDERVVYCRACNELPDDPILTSCRHFYCTECFTELLVNARGLDGRCFDNVACAAHGCNGFQIMHGYRQLNDYQFRGIAASVGVTIQEGPATILGELPSCRFEDITGDGRVFDNRPDDVAALWRSIDPDFDRSQSTIFRSPLAAMIDAADRVVEENEAKDEWWFGDGEAEEGWDRYRDDRSEGYKTEDGDADDEDEGLYDGVSEAEEGEDDDDDDETSEHSFVADDDAPIERPGRYILDSDSDIRASDTSDDESSSDDSDVSDVSETEARKLKKDWPSEWRPRVPRPTQRSRAQQQQIRRGGWSCHGLW